MVSELKAGYNIDGQSSQNQMNFIEPKGIPGVNSDAYHLGYFEDSTSYRSQPPVYTRFDGLLEALYIFGALLFGFLIITGISFGVREYTYSLKKRRQMFSSGSVWTVDSGISLHGATDRITHEAIIQQVRNPAYPSLKQQLNKDNLNEIYSPSANSEFDEARFTDARETARPLEKDQQIEFTPLEVVQDSPIYSSNSLDELLSDNDLLKTSNANKKIYSIKELFSLKPAEYHGRPLSGNECLEIQSVNQAMKLSIPVEQIKFQSAWTAEKTLTEISLYLTDEMVPRQPINDTSTKKIAILRFIAIAASSHNFRNPNVFLTPLTRTMDSLIDTGMIFDILSDTNPYMFKSLIEVVLQYCYAHWHFSLTPTDSIINYQFVKWKMNLPVIQPHHVIFRYLANLELGIYSAAKMNIDSVKSSESKIVTMLIYFTENAHCNDYMGFVPLIAQAVDYSERVYCQTLFYDLLHTLVKNHCNCCMEEYLKDDKSELKSIVQCGFWIKNDPAIRQLTEKIHMIVLDKNPKAMRYDFGILLIFRFKIY